MPRMSPLIFPSPSSSPFPSLALLQIARHAMANFRDIVLDPIKVEESESLAVGDTPNNPILISATPSPVLWGCFHRAPESDPITLLFRSLSPAPIPKPLAWASDIPICQVSQIPTDSTTSDCSGGSACSSDSFDGSASVNGPSVLPTAGFQHPLYPTTYSRPGEQSYGAPHKSEFSGYALALSEGESQAETGSITHGLPEGPSWSPFYKQSAPAVPSVPKPFSPLFVPQESPPPLAATEHSPLFVPWESPPPLAATEHSPLFVPWESSPSLAAEPFTPCTEPQNFTLTSPTASPISPLMDASETPSAVGDIDPTVPVSITETTAPLSIRADHDSMSHSHTVVHHPHTDPLIQGGETGAHTIHPGALTVDRVEEDPEGSIRLGPAEFAVTLPMDSRVKDGYERVLMDATPDMRGFLDTFFPDSQESESLLRVVSLG